MTTLWTDVALVALFVLIGGVFAAVETALVSLRDSQVRTLAQRGRRGARVANLAADPNRFLSAVQIGVTLAGFLAAAVGAATLAGELSPYLERWGVAPGLASPVALVFITLLIAYFSLVFGELAPKRLGHQRAEQVSLALAPAVDRLAQAARPVIWLLSASSDIVVRLAGGDPRAQRDVITEEELRELVAGHETLGDEERKIFEDVFSAGERQLREVMVPRTEVDFLDAKTPIFKAVQLAMATPHSRYPVVDGSHDNVVGLVHVRDLFAPGVASRSVRVEEIVRDVAFLPSTKHVLAALSEMRRGGQHLAIVLDEYGGTFGIVTLEDLVEELVGDIRDEYDSEEEVEAIATDGTMEVDGLLNLEDFKEKTGIELAEGPYETVAGFVMSQLGRIPAVGDTVSLDGWDLVVLQLDMRRIERLRVVPRRPADEGVEGEGTLTAGDGGGADTTAESAARSTGPAADTEAIMAMGPGLDGVRDPLSSREQQDERAPEQASSSTR